MNGNPEGGGGAKLPAIVGLLALVGLGGLGWWFSRPRLVDQLAVAEQATFARQKLLEQGPAAVDDLLAVAQDPTHLGRADAIELLGRIRDPRAVPVLLAVDDPNLAEVRIRALGQIEDERTLGPALDALHGPRAELSLAALFWLVKREDTPIDELVPLLASGRAGERALAAEGMGFRRHLPALDTLIEMLQDEEAHVREAAGRALLQLGDPRGNAAVDRAVERGAVTFAE
ncbi:MAG: HEAT repeat domain-containing protein [Planctomycetota bacterium]